MKKLKKLLRNFGSILLLLAVSFCAVAPSECLAQGGAPLSAMPAADITLRTAGGHQVRGYSATTEVARGTRLAAVIAAAADGDKIQLGPVAFDMGTTVLDQSVGGTKTVHIEGAGKYSTIIKSQVAFASNHACVHPGLSGCVTSDLTIWGTLVDGVYQAPWGARSSDSGFTGAILRNVRVIGASDCIFVRNNANCTARLYDVDCESEYDAFAYVQGSSEAHAFELYNCRLTSDGSSQPAFKTNGDGTGSTATGTISGINMSGAGTVKLFGCKIECSGNVASNCLGIGSSHASATVECLGGYIKTTNTASITSDIFATSGHVYLAGTRWSTGNGISLETKNVQLQVVVPGTNIATGDGKAYWIVPAAFNGMRLVNVEAFVSTAGTGGTNLTIQIANDTTVLGGGSADILSTKLTVDASTTHSVEASVPFVINTANDDMQQYANIRIDIDNVNSTPPKGLVISMDFAP